MILTIILNACWTAIGIKIRLYFNLKYYDIKDVSFVLILDL